MTSKPGGVTLVAMVALLLGIMGLLGCVSELLEIGFQSRTFQPVPAAGGDKTVELNRQMQEELRAVSMQWLPIRIPVLILGFPVFAGLVAGGILTLRSGRNGIKVLQAAIMFALPLELVRGGMAVAIARRVSAITAAHMQKILEASHPAQPSDPFSDLFSRIFPVFANAGLAAAAFWVIAKVVFFGFALRYLWKPEIRALSKPKPRPVPPPFPS